MSGWRSREQGSVAGLRSILTPRWAGVILTTRVLPDGSWKDVVAFSNETCPGSHVIVISRLADEELWAEVLNMGGFDLLAEPLNEDEVLRVATSAWTRCRTDARGASA